ncbi:MAG: HAMP domain-containing histidine kinase [Flammeovirgaceae bacterium]|nr:HAMP domain-containing histidine kinase [Flammeovirgaceae bacterium]
MYIRALYLHSVKSYDEAIVLLSKIMTEASDGGNLSFQRDAVLLLSKIYEDQNDLRKALAYRDSYHLLKAQLESDEISRSIEKLEFQIEMEKIEKENEQLKLSEAESKAILARREFQNNLLVIIFSFTALLALVFWINSKRRRNVNAKLNDQNQFISQQRAEISKQNDDLIQRNTQLSEINSEKDILMNIVAHDLKAPLARIEGLSNLIELDGVQQQQRLEYLSLLKYSTRSGLNLITDLLDVNMLEDKNQVVAYSSIVVNDFLKELLHPLIQQALGKSIEVKTEFSDFDAQVTTIPSYLSRIVENLVTNSIKFSYPKSTIWVGYHVVEQNLVLTVKDQGPGFTSHDKKYLFQKFKKTKRTSYCR